MVSNGKRISKFMCGSTDSDRSKPLSSQHRADEQRSYNDFGRVSLDEPDGGIVSGDKNWTDNEQSNTYLNPQSNAYHKPQSNVHSHIKPQDSAGPKPASIPPYHKLSRPEKYRPSPVKHNMQVIRGNATFVQLYKQRKHFNQIMRAAKDVSTIFKFLTCVVLDELDSLNFLKAANTLAQSGEAPPDLLSIILYLNHVLHVFDHREEIITLINTLYDRHSDYFLYVLRDHVLRNDDVKEVLAVVQHQSVHVFMCALAESNKQAVNSFFVDLMICRARMGSAILLSNVFKLVRYDRHAPKKCAFVVCTHRKRYNIDYTPIIQHLKDEAHMYTNINVLHALISIAGDDEHVVALIHAKMHKMRYRTMKRYGMSIKVLMCVFMARDVRKSNDIALFVNAMHELEDLSVNFNEREKRLYDELLVVLMENEKCMDVMVERMLDRVYGLVVLRNKRRRVGAYRVSACCRCGEKTCDGNENDEGVGVTVGSRKNAQRVAHDDTRNNKKRIKDCVCDEIGDEKKRRKIEKK
ncbi:hypothetical protein VCUG_01701 [Vavraia culicis subsp. floridensis]|uniref:Uncharacterized protein n=1 Tax=Vavraia culicis (isolate floridensis) TaxID=948595 RepID=L2GT02_VAVCU|nr:uncharacterized protein VCUG_01701 [Vavraia culicis subsp. floridensis]ELA46801.1 hypothetical protein VCUG_01701 [Vavraia culicis subsp. floridensis]